MDRQIQKLKQYLKKYLGKSENYVHKKMGKPLQFSGSDALLYYICKNLIFRDQIAFFIENGKMSDIVISECILGIPVRNIFYLPKNNIQYKVDNLIMQNLLYFLRKMF